VQKPGKLLDFLHCTFEPEGPVTPNHFGQQGLRERQVAVGGKFLAVADIRGCNPVIFRHELWGELSSLAMPLGRIESDFQDLARYLDLKFAELVKVVIALHHLPRSAGCKRLNDIAQRNKAAC
jgi:hypothetical protein